MIAPRSNEPDPMRSPKAVVMHTVRAWIESGRLASGDALPSERTMAAELGVARGTVRAAYDELTRQKVVIASSGRQKRVSGNVGRPTGLMNATIAVVSSLRPDPRASTEPRGNEEAPVYYAASAAISDAGYHVLTLSPDVLAGGQERIDALREHPPRGILVPADLEFREGGLDLARELVDTGLPCVFFSESERLAAYDRVTSDHEAGARSMVEWLADRGRRRILRLWAEDSLTKSWVAKRDAGYRGACRARGLEEIPPVALPTDQYEIHDRESFEAASRFFAGYLIEHLQGERRVDAIMCLTDHFAHPASRACRLFDIDPASDIDIVGYDNVWRWSPGFPYERTTLSATVDKHNASIGRAMVDLVVGRLDGRVSGAPQHVRVDPELVTVDAERTA